jgi:hypothetical protein
VNRIFVSVLAVFVMGLARDVKLNVLLDTTAPGAYNRWVWEHRTDCPGFKHVYITEDGWAGCRKFWRPLVTFWTDSGPFLMHCILSDSQAEPGPQCAPILDISRNTDQLTVLSGTSNCAVYNRFGMRLFTDPSRPLGLMSGRWVTYTSYPHKSLLVDDKGKVLNTLSSSVMERALYVDDSTFAMHSIDSTVVLFDRDGRVRWKSRRLRSHPVFAVGPKGRAVAVSTDDSLMIFSPPAPRAVTLPHDAEWGLFAQPTMAWSADSRLLALYQSSRTAWDSGRVSVLNTEGRSVRPVRKIRLYNVRSVLWMGDTLVLPALNIDRYRADSPFSFLAPADSCLVSFLLPSGDVSRGTFHGKFLSYGTWTASGGHLAYVLSPKRFTVAELVR